MSRIAKVAVIAGVLATVALVAARRGGTPAQADGPGRGAADARPLPRLVDVGADRCIPCKAMAPILEQLRADYPGRLEVTFVDVWKFPDLARPYGVRIIPTQIFLGADGRELARHQGFMSREDILAQWKALGVEL
jgi:thioredoxin 1